MTFTWNANGVAADELWIYVGTCPSNGDYLTQCSYAYGFNSSANESLRSLELTNLSTDGSPVVITLWYMEENDFQWYDVIFDGTSIKDCN